MEINVSIYLDYRDVIRNIAKKQRISFKSLATSCRIHSSYFSRVMTGKADFSKEQLYLIGADLGLVDWEMDYLLLLGEMSASGNNQHRSYIMQKVEAIREKKLKSIKEFSDIEEGYTQDQKQVYYQEAVTALVHMYMTIEKYREKPQLICGKIGIDDHKLELEIDKLEKLGIITVGSQGEITVRRFNMHLDEADPLIPLYHMNWRLDAVAYINQRRRKPSDFHMSAQFSTDEDSKNKIKEMFKQFVVDAQKITTQKKQNEEVFRIAFDLY